MKSAPKNFVVSLNVVSSKSTLQQMTGKLKVESSKGSRSMDKPSRMDSRSWVTIWLLDSGLKSHLALDRHIARVMALADQKLYSRKTAWPREWKVYLDVVVMHRTYTCTVKLKKEHLAWLSKRKAELRVSCYPLS